MSIEDLRCEISDAAAMVASEAGWLLFKRHLVAAGFALDVPYSVIPDPDRKVHIYTQKEEDLVIHALERMYG